MPLTRGAVTYFSFKGLGNHWLLGADKSILCYQYVTGIYLYIDILHIIELQRCCDFYKMKARLSTCKKDYNSLYYYTPLCLSEPKPTVSLGYAYTLKYQQLLFNITRNMRNTVYNMYSLVPPTQKIVLSFLLFWKPPVVLLEHPNKKHTVL